MLQCLLLSNNITENAVIRSLATPIKESNPKPENMNKEEFRSVYILYGLYLKALEGNDTFARKLNTTITPEEITIVDDVRLHAEVDFFQEHSNFTLIRLNTPLITRLIRLGAGLEDYLLNNYISPTEQEHLQFNPRWEFPSLDKENLEFNLINVINGELV